MGREALPVRAIAYYNSAPFKKILADTKKRYDDAEAAGDDKIVKEILAARPKLQKQLHSQGFGNAPVDNILELLKDEIPKIAARANVDLIVSKWHVVYCQDLSSCVDVSFLLSEKFHPNEQTLQDIKAAVNSPVSSPEELENHEE